MTEGSNDEAVAADAPFLVVAGDRCWVMMNLGWEPWDPNNRRSAAYIRTREGSHESALNLAIVDWNHDRSMFDFPEWCECEYNGEINTHENEFVV